MRSETRALGFILCWAAAHAVAWGAMLSQPGCGGGGGVTEPVDAALEATVPDAYIPVCGNGRLDTGEECDDGNRQDGDGCDSKCHWETFCGNNLIETGEDCDGTDLPTNCVWDGHLGGQTLCLSDCTIDATCYDPPDGDAQYLEAWYKLETTAMLLSDSSGNGKSCLATNQEGGYPGQVGSSSLFDQQNLAYADCGQSDATNLAGFSEMTIEVWIHLNTYTPPGGQMRVIISRNLSSDENDLAYLLAVAGSPYASNNYHLMFATHSMNATDIVFSADPLATTQWYHVAAVYTPGELSMYVDGVFSASVSQSATGPIRAIAGSHTYLAGLYDTAEGDPQEVFDGFLDEVKIWSVARTEEEICKDGGGFHDAQADPTCRYPE